MKSTRTLYLWLVAAASLLLGCSTESEPKPLPEGFIERVPEEIVFTNADLSYMGDAVGEQTSDGWVLKLYTDMEIDLVGNPIGPGCVMQIMLNAPYNPDQEPSMALLRGAYSAQTSSGNFSPGTFVDGYIQYIQFPGERIELPDATFFATIGEGSTDMDVDLIDDGVVQISGAGDEFAIEDILVGKKCIKALAQSFSCHRITSYLLALIISSARSILPSRSQNAISGSIIQNSEACLAVLEFSALKVGPNV